MLRSFTGSNPYTYGRICESCLQTQYKDSPSKPDYPALLQPKEGADSTDECVCKKGYVSRQAFAPLLSNLFGRKNTVYQISLHPHERTVTPLYQSLSVTDSESVTSVTSHCITLTLLGSTIKVQEPSQETKNWGLPARTNPPLVCNTQNTGTTKNNCYRT
jgi:hypothetical protein